MTIEQVVVPELGDFDKVEVIEVLVKVGDTVALDDSIVSLESDKASMEIPSTQAGTVCEVAVAVGDQVSLGALLIRVNTSVDEPEDVTVAVEAPLEKIADNDYPVVDEPTVAATREAGTESAKLQSVVVPDLGDVADVEIIEILVKPGDQVAKDDSLISLESDKAAMEIPSPYAGEVVSLSVAVGDKVAQGADILQLRVAQDSSLDSEAPAPAPAPAPVEVVEPIHTEAARPSPTAAVDHVQFVSAYASPSVRKFARELGVDLSMVSGSGRKGRILKADVQGYVKLTLNEKPVVAAAAPAVMMSGAGIPPMPEIDFSAWGNIETQPLTRINRLTGKTLSRAWLHVPHVTQFDEADITELESFRQSLVEEYKPQGIKMTMLAFLLKACASALKTYPRFCSSLDSSGESLVLKQYCNIGIAVDTPAGLVVPVIKDVDKKSLLQLAQDMREMSAKARDKKLTPSDMQGGCFTISSLGGIGGTTFTPIVNAPEVAILGVSRAAMAPHWNGEEFVPRLMLPLALSYDHRVIDGADGARFTRYLATVLADTRRLLL